MNHVAEVLGQLFVLLLAAKIGDEIFKRIGQPPVIGEILAGVVVGPSLLGWYEINAETQLFAEIGVVLLLFQVGLETRLHDLVRVGPTALAVGALGVLLPFAGGFLLAEVLGSEIGVAVFLAAALTATSVGITSGVLRDLGAPGTQSGRVILGAAVMDDALAMLILAFASGLAAGSVELDRLGLLLLVAGLFIAIVLIGGTRILRRGRCGGGPDGLGWLPVGAVLLRAIVLVGGSRLLRRRRSVRTDPEFAECPFLPGMISVLGLAALASEIGLAAIIGAFLAGMVVGESSERHALESEVAPVAAFFTPFFFGFIGAQVDLAGLANLQTLALVAGVTAIAVGTKFIGAFLGAVRLGRAEATLIGWGMVPRGEVGIVVAGLGLQIGAI